MNKHYKLKNGNQLVIYGVKLNGDFETSLNPELKIKDLVKGFTTTASVWYNEDDESDLTYKVLNTWLGLDDYIKYLYGLYKDRSNYDTAYLYRHDDYKGID